MKKNLNSKFLSFIIPLFLFLNLSACAQNTTPKPNTNEPVPNTKNDMGKRPMDSAELTTRADKIAKEVATIKGIQSAHVVISQEKALVGLNMDKNIEGKLTDKIKTEVEEKVKKTDDKIKTVAVSAEPNLVQRIQNVGKGIFNGKPLSEFGTEIEEIFKRIIPSK